jgi:hypothetical protein
MGFIYDFRDGRDRYHLELMHARSSRTSCPRHPPRWAHVRAQLTRKDVVALALQGFDNPAPASFTSTKEAYADWITQQLETVGTPVDLVGPSDALSHRVA